MNSTKVGGNTMRFEMKVMDEMKAGALAIDAIFNAAKKFPELFTEFFERIKKTGQLRFEDRVGELLKKGMGKTRAFDVIAQEHPDLYADYLRRVNAGENIIFNLGCSNENNRNA